MLYECYQCGAEYKDKEKLMRHVREKHPKKVLQCGYCRYTQPSSKQYQMRTHIKNRHMSKIENPRRRDIDEKIHEINIPATPFVERPSRPQPSHTENRKKVKSLVNSMRKKEKESVKETPEKDNDSFSNISSPASITLGIEDHGEVTPIKKNLITLFASPVKVISPLPPSPKKRKIEETENFVVIEDDTLPPNAPPQRPEVYKMDNNVTVTNKKDKTHLKLPNEETVKRGNKWDRFVATPSDFVEGEKADKLREVRNRAREAECYKGAVVPLGYQGVRKEERVVFPDGTMYSLSAFWMANPVLETYATANTQTETNTSEASINTEISVQQRDCEIQTESTAAVTATTQTDIRNVVFREDDEEEMDDVRVVELIDNFCSYIS